MKPGPVLFTAVLLWLVLGAAAFFSESIFFIWLAAGAGIVPFIIIDFCALLLLTDPMEAERSLPGALALGEKTRVSVRITRTRGLPARSMTLFDIYPDSMEVSVFPVRLKVPKKDEETVFEYSALPLKRGGWEFPEVQILLGSFLGFWRRKTVRPFISRGRTFPDYKKLTGSAALEAVMEQTGLKDVRKRGQGMEFMSLREYQKGDSIRAVDWRATGRRRKVIVREYQEEQDQQVLFLLDSGYRLHRQEEAPVHPASRTAVQGASGTVPGTAASGTASLGTAVLRRTQFDSALEAAMILSWAALKHGDAVAAGCFGAEDRWLPPRKGVSALPAIMRSFYDVRSAPAPSSLFSALENALTRLKRRTFIIMVSNFREEDGESLSWIIRRVQSRHLLLLVSLREPEAEAVAERIPSGEEEALETAAARSYLEARKKLYAVWEHRGILTMECPSSKLTPMLVSRYLEVKRSGLL